MGLLDERVVIVTGAAKGIGKAYCEGLAREGAKVLAADLAPCDEVAAMVSSLGGEVVSVQADVSDVASTENMAQVAVEKFGRIDGLVNNAAFYMGVTHGPT